MRVGKAPGAGWEVRAQAPTGVSENSQKGFGPPGVLSVPQSRNMSWRLLLGKPVGPRQVWQKGGVSLRDVSPNGQLLFRMGALGGVVPSLPGSAYPLVPAAWRWGRVEDCTWGRGEGQSCLSHPKNLWAQPPYTLMWDNEPAMEDP